MRILQISIEMAAFSIENSAEKRPFQYKFVRALSQLQVFNFQNLRALILNTELTFWNLRALI